MSMVCIAMMSGPVKHSTYWSISGSEQYWNNTGSCWRRERREEERKGERKGQRRGERRRGGRGRGRVHSEPKALDRSPLYLKVLYLGDSRLIFLKLTLYNGHIFHHRHHRDLVCMCAQSLKPARFRLILQAEMLPTAVYSTTLATLKAIALEEVDHTIDL